MKFKSGDKVRFLNEIGEGRITGFQDNNIALVEMEDGFEIPMKISELLKIQDEEEYVIEGDEMKQTIATEESVSASLPDQINLEKKQGIYFAIVKIGVDRFTLNIINDTDYFINYVIGKSKDGNMLYINSGQLEDNTKIIINTVSLEQLKNLEFITIQVILYGKKSYDLQDPINKTIDIKNLSFQNQAFIENDYFDEKAIIIKLENDDLAKEISKLTDTKINAIIKTKEEKVVSVGDFLKKKKKQANKPEEVDLHIESIVDDHYNMSPGEIINTQLSRFEIALKGAINNNQQRIVFIHGVGNGKLKYEMGKILDRKYPDLKYQDASFKEYGYGAMMVIIK